MRERCYQCFRPRSLCFCHAIPQIDNRTDVLILQHIGERYHAFNTARIVQKALRRCQVIVDHNLRLGDHALPIAANTGLLYPGEGAPCLTDLPVNERPEQLVIIDGTWHQAKTILRDVPQLRTLPCYRLSPSQPGQYRIRREPNAQSLSTLEATVAALSALEPETVGLDQLLTAFHTMVQSQVSHPSTHGVWRKNQSRQNRPRNLPQALLQRSDRLVVAYGESTPGRPGEPASSATPVNWVAQRLGTTERFSCRLKQQRPLTPDELSHMRLSAADFDNASQPEEFRRQWNRFLRPHDVLVVYHQRTSRLLRQIGATQPDCLVLKSTFGRWQSDFHSMEELMAAEGLSLPTDAAQERAKTRMEMAVALVEHLRTAYGKLS